MGTLRELRLGTIALIVIAFLVALAGYLSNDDALFDLGIAATFVSTLVAGAVLAYANSGD